MLVPLILAGPIVRRATPERVHVWLATSELLEPPHLTIFSGSARSAAPLDSEPEWYPVAMGQHFFVYLLVAKLKKPLTTGTEYGYDVLIKGVRTLFDDVELEQLVLRGRDRPSFVLGPNSSPNMKAMYGSCRKLHGPRPDMMAAAETRLQDAKPNERPQYLFLGGDQIYADDVHPAVLELSTPLEVLLLGRPEVIPGLPARAYSKIEPRTEYLKPFFTSGHMDHHLLSFGEFVTAYLLAWNENIWKFLRRSRPNVGKYTLIPAGAMAAARSARRVLANTVTYMIFDDHEVTDDWFRSESWTKNALKHRVAERVMTNGIVAYWAFQGWGNDPDQFDQNFREMLQGYGETGGRHQQDIWKQLAKMRWSYVTPTSPRVLVLDTRTQRTGSKNYEDAVDFGFSGGAIHPFSPGVLAQGIHSSPEVQYRRRNVEAPRLLDKSERNRVAALLSSQTERGEPLVVVAPSPIFGFPPLEWLQAEGGKVDANATDLESWAANPRNLIDAVSLFTESRPDPLVILSGDVHYGFEVVGRIVVKNGSIPFVQLCSSALKNRATGGEAKNLKRLSLFANKDRSTAYWDLRENDDDGPLAWMETDKRSIDTFSDLFGDPIAMIQTQFVQRPGRRDVHNRIEMDNNLGELVIERNRVFHRHWIADEGEKISARDWSDWKTWDWPIPDPFTALFDTLFGNQ